MIWTIEKRKQGNEIWVSSNVQPESIFVGEGYMKKEYKRSIELAEVIADALNEYEKKQLDPSKHPEYESQQDQYYSSSIQRHE
jgi:hypothetical protein